MSITRNTLNMIVFQFFHIILMAGIAFALLFDKSGVALGVTIFGELSPVLMSTATILGNITWVYGLVLWILAFVLFVVILIPNIISNTINQAHESGKLKNYGNVSVFILAIIYTDLILGIFSLGSGFWFTGIGIILVNGMILYWYHIIIQARDKKLQELSQE